MTLFMNRFFKTVTQKLCFDLGNGCLGRSDVMCLNSGAQCSFLGKFQNKSNHASGTLVVLLTWTKLVNWCQVSMSCVSCAWTRFRNSFTLGMAFSTAASRLNSFQRSRKPEMFSMFFFNAYQDMRWHASDYILQNLLRLSKNSQRI